MSTLKTELIALLKVIVYLCVGLLLTVGVLQGIYERFGIPFQGEVWVNWFGVSYLVYFFVTMIYGIWIHPKNDKFQRRVRSIFFWVLFVGAVYVVGVPFWKGENPF